VVRLARWQLEGGEILFGEIHFGPPLWEELGKIKAVFPCLPVALSGINRQGV
jgi:hypothetical protein